MNGQCIHTHYKVRNHDIDAYGHVNNAAYLRIVEDALVDALEFVEIDLLRLSKENKNVYMTEICVQYRKPSFLGDCLELRVSFPQLSRVKIRWHVTIERAVSGDVLTRLQGCAAFVNGENRVMPIPDSVRAALRPYAGID